MVTPAASRAQQPQAVRCVVQRVKLTRLAPSATAEDSQVDRAILALDADQRTLLNIIEPDLCVAAAVGAWLQDTLPAPEGVTDL
jgi:hypothetical protein